MVVGGDRPNARQRHAAGLAGRCRLLGGVASRVRWRSSTCRGSRSGCSIDVVRGRFPDRALGEYKATRRAESSASCWSEAEKLRGVGVYVRWRPRGGPSDREGRAGSVGRRGVSRAEGAARVRRRLDCRAVTPPRLTEGPAPPTLATGRGPAKLPACLSPRLTSHAGRRPMSGMTRWLKPRHDRLRALRRAVRHLRPAHGRAGRPNGGPEWSS